MPLDGLTGSFPAAVLHGAAEHWQPAGLLRTTEQDALSHNGNECISYLSHLPPRSVRITMNCLLCANPTIEAFEICRLLQTDFSSFLLQSVIFLKSRKSAVRASGIRVIRTNDSLSSLSNEIKLGQHIRFSIWVLVVLIPLRVPTTLLSIVNNGPYLSFYHMCSEIIPMSAKDNTIR